MCTENFNPTGVYTMSNVFSCEVELSNDGESARIKWHGTEKEQPVSEWLPIEHIESEDGEFEPVIDPNGENIPLSLVMRI